MTHMNHDEPYSEAYLQDILKSVKTIAMVEGQPRQDQVFLWCSQGARNRL